MRRLTTGSKRAEARRGGPTAERGGGGLGRTVEAALRPRVHMLGRRGRIEVLLGNQIREEEGERCWGIQENTSPSKRRSLMALSKYVFQEQGIRKSRKSETYEVSNSRMCRVRGF
jgi:hypothetical protein